MTLKQARKNAIKKLPIWEKICFYTGVILVWCEEDLYGRSPVECHQFNKWNPLTYLTLFIIMIYAAGKGIGEMFKENPFKIEKW